MGLQCLHVTRGEQLWTYDTESGVNAVNITPLEFIRRPNPDKQYRLVGTAVNANLIINLHNNTSNSVQVVTPLVAETNKIRKDVHTLLPRVYHCNLPAQLGGPHDLQPSELINYKLACKSIITDDELEQHPFLYRLRWMRGLNMRAVIQLLGIIIDPRWYVDLNNPNRLSKLYAYLKLDPKHMQLTAARGTSHYRCNAALACWHTPKLAAMTGRNYSHFGAALDLDTPVFGLAPEDWLWRMWWYLTDFGKYSAINTHMPPAKDIYSRALLKVTKRFIKFIYHLWMEALYPDNTEWQFRAKDFLHYTSEIDSFNQTVGSSK